MLVDVHAHHYPGPYLEALAAAPGCRHEVRDRRESYYTAGGLVLRFPTPAPSVEDRLATMDEVGIDRQLLSLAGAGVMFHGAQGPALARVVNDELLSMASGHPNRFGVLLTLPLPDVDASLAELGRVGREAGVAGVCLLTTAGSSRLEDPGFTPLWNALDALGHVVLVHPTVSAAPYDGPHPDLALSIGFPHETVKALAGLLIARHIQRSPRIQWVFSHLGGGLAAYWDRLTSALVGLGAADSPAALTELVRTRLWFDSMTSHAPALRCFVDTFGPDPVVLGTDYPHLPAAAGRRTLDGDPAAEQLLAAARRKAQRLGSPCCAGSDEQGRPSGPGQRQGGR